MIKKHILKAIAEEKELGEYEEALLSHGFDILISDGINYLVAIVLSFFLHTEIHTFIFVFLLGMLRINTGGWHSSTRLGCFFSYQCLVLLSDLYVTIHVFPVICHILFTVSFIYIWLNSPSEHINNPLSEEERKKNRLSARLKLSLIGILYIVCRHTPILYTLSSIVIVNCALMALLQISSYRRGHVDQMCTG